MKQISEYDRYDRAPTPEETAADLAYYNACEEARKAEAQRRDARDLEQERQEIIDDPSQWRKEFGMDMPVMINGKPHFSGVN